MELVQNCVSIPTMLPAAMQLTRCSSGRATPIVTSPYARLTDNLSTSIGAHNRVDNSCFIVAFTRGGCSGFMFQLLHECSHAVSVKS